MPDGLYERDTLLWSEQQADLLRRLAAGERVNEAVDWPNVIEEVFDVGMSELRRCRSLLQQAMTHILWIYAYPDSPAVDHWFDEVGAFLDDAVQRYAPSMRQRIDVADLYAWSLKRAGRTRKDAGEPRSLPETCPFTLDDLLARDIEALLSRLAP